MTSTVEVTLESEQFAAYRVVSVEEVRELNRPAFAKVRAILRERIALDDLLGDGAKIGFARAGVKRTFRGVIEEARVVASPPLEDGGRTAPTYEFVIRSQLALLGGAYDCRIFQNQTTKQIVTTLLTEHGFPEDQQKWDLSGEYPERVHTTQYRESVLHFISRLLEQEGIHFSTTVNDDDLEVVVLSDDSTAATFSPESALPRRKASSQDAAETAVYGFDRAGGVHHGKLTLTSFDFERPELDLLREQAGERFEDLEAYQARDAFVSPEEALRRGKLRLEEARVQAALGSFTTDDLRVLPGRAFKIEVERTTVESFVTRTVLSFIDTTQSKGGQHEFWIRGVMVDRALPYRPKKTHARPKIYGPQTATVVAEPGTKPEGLLTDKYGRVKVRFHWDRYASDDDKASSFMRVAQLQTSGSMVLPRVGWEVVVEFIDGDPDQPLVTGRVYNRVYMPPYALPEGKTRTSLQTSSSPSGGGRNEIRFEDAAGAEEVMINSQYNTLITVANNRKKKVQANETLIVGNNATSVIGADQTIKVTNGAETTVGASRSLSVGGERKVEVNAVYGQTVGASSTTSIGADWMYMVGSPLDALIALGTAQAVAVAQAQADKAFAQIQGAAEGAVAQVMGPVQGLADEASRLEAGMQAVADGQAAAQAGLLGGVLALPTPAGVLRSLAQGPAALNSADGGGASAGSIALGGLLESAASGGIKKAVKAARTASLGEAAGSAGSAAGGSSEANSAGPDGALSGFSQEDLTAGPGYAQYLITGDHEEVIGGNRLAVAVEAVNYNLAASFEEKVGAAHVEVVAGDRATAVDISSSETQVGLVVVAKGGEVETVHGARQLNIGGALSEKIAGDCTIEGGVSVSITGAVHDLKAKSKITIQCGASSIVIDGGGVTMTTPVLSLTGSGIKATKSVADG